MPYSNELPIYHGSDAWEAIKRSLAVVDRSKLSSDDIIELDYFVQQMRETEEDD